MTLLVVLLAFLLAIVTAQTAPQPAEPQKQVPGVGVSVQERPQSSPAEPKSPQVSQPQPDESETSKPITKAQAKELFRSVDEILQFVSQDTGLPVKHKVKRKLITRGQVESYVAKRMKNDKDTQRLERAQLVLVKFGLIPAGYDLHGEFLKLLGEQVAAYYDSKTKTVNLLDWVQPELQRPVLAHELTHALQDQAVGLEKWAAAGQKDDKPLPDLQEQVVEEAQAARQNVTEGQAMLAMLDYTLAPAGLNVLTAPDLVNAMRASMGGDSKESPVLATAPMFLRESLMMPYSFGLDFERTVLQERGKSHAFLGTLEKPPADTRQIMEPESYLQDSVAQALPVPDLDKLIAPDYERYDFAGMGAFDVYLLARQYAPDEDAKQYYRHWRGGYYLAAHQKTAPKGQIALLYVSRWDSPQAAAAFQKLYSSYVPIRYHLGSTNGVAGDGGGADPRIEWNVGTQGKVLLEAHDRELLIMEGLDDATMNRLRSALTESVNDPQTHSGPSVNLN